MITDIIVLAILLIFVISGYRKGFISSVMNLITVIVAALSAWTFSPILSAYFNEKIVNGIQQTVKDALDALTNGGDGNSLATLFAERPAALTEILERYHIGINSAEDKFYSVAASGEGEINSELARFVSLPVGNALSNVLSFIAIFVGVFILLKLITLILNLFFDLPVLSTLNKLAGLIFGLICGVGTAFIIVLVVNASYPVLCSVLPDLFTEKAAENSICIGLIRQLLSGGGIISTFSDYFRIVTVG